MHINHRRKNKAPRKARWTSAIKGDFKVSANSSLRNMTRQTIRNVIAQGADWEDVIFPLQDEAEDWWNFD